MRNGLLVQVLGSVVVLLALLLGEGMAYLLYRSPGNPLLCYLNMEVFAPFSPYEMSLGSTLRTWFTPDTIFALLAVLFVSYTAKQRIVIGVYANLSSMYMGTLTYKLVVSAPTVKSASLIASGVGPSLELGLLLFVFVFSACSAILSHVSMLKS